MYGRIDLLAELDARRKVRRLTRHLEAFVARASDLAYLGNGWNVGDAMMF